VINVYPDLTFKTEYVSNVPEAVGKLISGEIDAFITVSVFALSFAETL
jgi:ABC-type amino acid transport substrate-binding protein